MILSVGRETGKTGLNDWGEIKSQSLMQFIFKKKKNRESVPTVRLPILWIIPDLCLPLAFPPFRYQLITAGTNLNYMGKSLNAKRHDPSGVLK